jgi:hypothetical protein
MGSWISKAGNEAGGNTIPPVNPTETGTGRSNETSESQAQSNTPKEDESTPPLVSTLSLPREERDLSGKIPFTIYVDWTLTGTRRICAYFSLYCSQHCGICLREMEGKRKIRLSADQIMCETDEIPEFSPEYRFGIKDPALLRVRPGDRFGNLTQSQSKKDRL